MIVLSDTSPLNYLVLIGEVHVLPTLFGEVVVPMAVCAEMQHVGTPEAVRKWISSPPDWLLIRAPIQIDASIELGAGEVEAISLAIELHADLLLMDDRRGRRIAESRDLPVAGTVNVLEAAAERDLLDLRDAIAKLRLTNFHVSPSILTRALEADALRRKSREI